jgi:hypothetical protein
MQDEGPVAAEQARSVDALRQVTFEAGGFVVVPQALRWVIG